ncbi:hypothetical protein ACQKKL_28520, partial [Escherichia coli]|uniref:hypothetical protein n=6 Tax=Gammaproteobacteria TaxID=1236 RepID=UPI003D07D74D
MECKLCVVEDSTNTINKEINVVKSIELKLRGSLDIVTPELILVGSDFENDYNYLIINGRNYFVNEIVSLGNNRYKYFLEMDVVETYKDNILNSDSRFRRNLKTGDYVSNGFDESTIKKISLHESDKSLVSGSTMILTTIGS